MDDRHYVTRTEYVTRMGHEVRNGGQGKCDDAWNLFAMAHRHGIRDRTVVFAAGVSIGMNAGNLRTEFTPWANENAITDM